MKFINKLLFIINPPKLTYLAQKIKKKFLQLKSKDQELEMILLIERE